MYVPQKPNQTLGASLPPITQPRGVLHCKTKFNKTIFSYLLVVKELLKNTSDWGNFVTKLAALIEEYKDDIELYRLGFPENWQNLLLA